MKSIWRANSNGILILTAATVSLVLLTLPFTTVSQTTTIDSNGTISEGGTTYPFAWFAIVSLSVLLAYPVSMSLGRRLRMQTGEGLHLVRVIPLLALPPIVFLSLLIDIVLHARIVLGYWPAPYSPAPKELGIDLGYLILGWAVFTPLSALVIAHVLIKSNWPTRVYEGIISLVVMIFSWSVFLWVIKHDPGSFLSWLAD